MAIIHFWRALHDTNNTNNIFFVRAPLIRQPKTTKKFIIIGTPFTATKYAVTTRNRNHGNSWYCFDGSCSKLREQERHGTVYGNLVIHCTTTVLVRRNDLHSSHAWTFVQHQPLLLQQIGTSIDDASGYERHRKGCERYEVINIVILHWRSVQLPRYVLVVSHDTSR